MMDCLSEDKSGSVALTVYVQPKASRDAVAGLHGDAVKVCITAPPVEGKANAAVTRLLAKMFGLPKSAVALHRGHQSRTKKFLLQGLSLTDAQKVLEKYL
jgi:uncharacterized protein (TIGR00251 family)